MAYDRGPMPDETITCKDCGKPFMFSEGEAAFYAERQYTPPKRCKPCRAEKKSRQEDGAPRARR